MDYIEWKKDYELDIPEIDLQHKNLVNMLNQLHDFILKDQGISKHEIQDLLVGLTNYTVYHFDSEEEFQVKIDYQGFEAHRKQHEAFKEKVIHALDLYDNDALNLHEMEEYLKGWLLNHIAKEDMAFAMFAKTLQSN